MKTLSNSLQQMELRMLFIIIVFLASSSTLLAQTNAITTGPEKGALIVAGGGYMGDKIMDRFIELAGGLDASIIVIPTASGILEHDSSNSGLAKFSNRGATNVTILHTTDPEVADSETFVGPLLEADGVWFNGGRQWRLMDTYSGTRTEKELWEVLNRGGVIGGSSAGATIQGSYLARGDTKNNQIMMGDHEEGLGFIKNIAIDQHVLARNRQFDLFNILEKKPELLGIGIDESTAIVVQGNQFEVLGASYVLIYDGNFWSREGSDLKVLPPGNQLFYMLRSGDKYDMSSRQVLEK